MLDGNYYARQIVADSGYPATYGIYVRINQSNYYLHIFANMTNTGYGDKLWIQSSNRSAVNANNWHQVY